MKLKQYVVTKFYNIELQIMASPSTMSAAPEPQ